MAKVKIPKQLFSDIYPKTHFSDATPEQLDQLGKIAKLTIIKAVESELPPSSIQEDDACDFIHHHHITFNQKIDRPLKTAAKSYGVSPAIMYLKMLISGMDKDLHSEFKVANNSNLSRYINAIGFEERTHQSVFYSHMEDALFNKKCGMVEGGTGIGKTLATIAAANETAINNEQRVVISVDSLSNLNQYASTYKKLKEDCDFIVPLVIILGLSNFVSVTRLNDIMDEPEYLQYKDDVNTWLLNGGLHDVEDQSLTPFLLSSLEKVCPALPINEIRLLYSEKDDVGMNAYQEQFEIDNAPTSIILCTHAMLCVDAKRRVYASKSDEFKLVSNEYGQRIAGLIVERESTDLLADKKALGLNIRDLIRERHSQLGKLAQDDKLGFLPHYDFLIVDEAHLLENAMSNSISTTFSFKGAHYTVKKMVKKGVLSKSVEKKVSDAIETISQAGGVENVDLKNDSSSELKNAVSNFCDAILKSKGLKKCPEEWIKEIRFMSKQLSNLHTYNQHLSISFSPIRKYPQAILGSGKTGGFLGSLWNQTTASCCVSATLYFKKYLEYSASHFINILNIPIIRSATYAPVIPPWLKSPVTGFYLPAMHQTHLRPLEHRQATMLCQNDVAEKLNHWHAAISKSIEEIHRTGKGGTLVLMTSFMDVTAVADHLSEFDLVFASGENTLAKQKQEFIALSKKGKRPIWLGLGGAWTGLDVNGTHIGLSSKDITTEDNVITDLIIPKIPFGLNMSLSHQLRKKQSNAGGLIEILDTAIRFMQGVGRLIRLDNQPQNRRVFLLDGRINDKKRKGAYAPINNFINTFQHVKTLGPEHDIG